MMGLAKGLPVVLDIPEETGVSPIWDDVIDNCGRCYSPFLLTYDA
jgi:hypothetical protein